MSMSLLRFPGPAMPGTAFALILVLTLLAGGCAAPEKRGADATALLDIDDPQLCSACHQAVYAEWTESMHSRAHHQHDPIYGNMRTLRVSVQGEGIAPRCARCHTPRSADAPDATGTPAADHGVSCAACHNVTSVHPGQGREGVDALAYAGGTMLRAARDVPPNPASPHATGAALPELADGETLCLACHDATRTPGGAPACTTGPEYAASASGQTCVDCHMPTEPGPVGVFGRQEEHASHRFLGPHRAWYQDDPSLLRDAIALEGRFEGGTLVVGLENRSAHGFPSGFPGRQAFVHVTGQDASGAIVWENFRDDPMREDPAAVLNKVYRDEAERPSPAAFSASLARDNRLRPDERRELRWAVPRSVVRARVRVTFRLLPQGLARRLELTEAVEAEPREIAALAIER
jgi:hypothetical protein